MANATKNWIQETVFTITDGTEYTFTGRSPLVVTDAAHRAELMKRGCFAEAGVSLRFTAPAHVPGDNGALYAVDANARVTVDDANVGRTPAGVIEDPA